MRMGVMERSAMEPFLIEAAERRIREGPRKLREAGKFFDKLSLYLIMQLKLFILPVKNHGDAEVEMNVFLRAHRVLSQRFGVSDIGLEPGDPWRQLEQQCQELPGGEPQQQLAGQKE